MLINYFALGGPRASVLPLPVPAAFPLYVFVNSSRDERAGE